MGFDAIETTSRAIIALYDFSFSGRRRSRGESVLFQEVACKEMEFKWNKWITSIHACLLL